MFIYKQQLLWPPDDDAREVDAYSQIPYALLLVAAKRPMWNASLSAVVVVLVLSNQRYYEQGVSTHMKKWRGCMEGFKSIMTTFMDMSCIYLGVLKMWPYLLMCIKLCICYAVYYLQTNQGINTCTLFVYTYIIIYTGESSTSNCMTKVQFTHY